VVARESSAVTSSTSRPPRDASAEAQERLPKAGVAYEESDGPARNPAGNLPFDRLALDALEGASAGDPLVLALVARRPIAIAPDGLPLKLGE